MTEEKELTEEQKKQKVDQVMTKAQNYSLRCSELRDEMEVTPTEFVVAIIVMCEAAMVAYPNKFIGLASILNFNEAIDKLNAPRLRRTESKTEGQKNRFDL